MLFHTRGALSAPVLSCVACVCVIHVSLINNKNTFLTIYNALLCRNLPFAEVHTDDYAKMRRVSAVVQSLGADTYRWVKIAIVVIHSPRYSLSFTRHATKPIAHIILIKQRTALNFNQTTIDRSITRILTFVSELPRIPTN